MNYFAVHATALGAMQGALGDDCPTFIWNGNPPIPIIPGTVKQRKKLEIGGFSMDSDLKFLVRVCDLPQNGQPTLKQTIIYLNMQFRLDAITTYPGGQVLEYELMDLNQGA